MSLLRKPAPGEPLHLLTFDFETGGLEAARHALTEVGVCLTTACHKDGEVVVVQNRAGFGVRVGPDDGDVGGRALQVQGASWDDLDKGVPIATAARFLVDVGRASGGDAWFDRVHGLLAWNSAFDYAFLERLFARVSRRVRPVTPAGLDAVLCEAFAGWWKEYDAARFTQEWSQVRCAKALFKHAKSRHALRRKLPAEWVPASNSLSAASPWVLGREQGKPHRAQDDAALAGEVSAHMYHALDIVPEVRTLHGYDGVTTPRSLCAIAASRVGLDDVFHHASSGLIFGGHWSLYDAAVSEPRDFEGEEK